MGKDNLSNALVDFRGDDQDFELCSEANWYQLGSFKGGTIMISIIQATLPQCCELDKTSKTAPCRPHYSNATWIIISVWFNYGHIRRRL